MVTCHCADVLTLFITSKGDKFACTSLLLPSFCSGIRHTAVWAAHLSQGHLAHKKKCTGRLMLCQSHTNYLHKSNQNALVLKLFHRWRTYLLGFYSGQHHSSLILEENG